MEIEKDLKTDDSYNLLLKYDTEKEQFHFVEHTVKKAKENLKQEQENNDVFFQNGKLIVKETPDESGKKRRREDKYATMESILHQEQEEKGSKENQSKAKADKKNKGALLPFDPVHVFKESGGSYRPHDSVTGGDVKVKGKPEPYAFVQLNPKALNKRYRNKASRAFEMIMNKKTSGGLKGLKQKILKTN